MQPIRVFLCLTVTFLLAGCSSPGATDAAGDSPQALASAPKEWQLTNSTTLGLIRGVGLYAYSSWFPASCARAEFRIPGGTHFLEAVLQNPPVVNPGEPGAGGFSIGLIAPNQTRVFGNPTEDGGERIEMGDPAPGRWTAQVWAHPVVVNQYANLTVTMRGTGNATGSDELVFWKETGFWEPALQCPGSD